MYPVNGDNYLMMSMMDASQPKRLNGMNDMFVRLYECPFCGNGFITLWNCRRHTYRHFKGYFVYRCSYCNHGFMQMNRIKAHMQSWHPYKEINYEKIDPPNDPVILINIPKPRNSNAPGATRLASVTTMFKCAFCDHVCIPTDMVSHFKHHHPIEVPQMKILKDQNLLEKIPELPVTLEKRVAKISTAARHVPPVSSSPQIPVSLPVTVEPARKNIALKSTAKRAYNFPSLKDQNLLEKIPELPVTREKRVAKMSLAARHIPPVSSSPQILVSRPVTVEPARKNIASKSTAKRAYNFPSLSTPSMNSVINEFLSNMAEPSCNQPSVTDKKLKIWNRNRSFYVSVKDLKKMINFNCTVRLHDIINIFL